MFEQKQINANDNYNVTDNNNDNNYSNYNKK